MVLLTMTTAMVEALESLQNHCDLSTISQRDEAQEASSEPSLFQPSVGKPISHRQIVYVSTQTKEWGVLPCHLDELLKGSRAYTAPPPAKPEPTSEYKALMAKLRREEEARCYERMVNPVPPQETYSNRFPTSSAANAFSSTAAYESSNSLTAENDELTYSDINRQVTLIFNVLVSVFACAAAIWVVAKWWSTPARLALSMSGSLLVGIAEVVIYTGYIRKIGEAKVKEGAVKEVKEIFNTWAVGGDKLPQNHSSKVVAVENKGGIDSNVRRRKVKSDTNEVA